MTDNRRIVVNILATYGRSLFGLACGLLTSRWILEALGETDYGLFGVVGGLMAFIGLVNRTLAVANSRFYAFSVGGCKTAADPDAAIEVCRRWFNVALFVHTIVPVVLLAVGYPVGEWLIRNWLTVPADRINSCLVAFRFACLAGFFGMATVPFGAMYGAKQEIAELTVYSFVGSVVMLAFGYYMVSHPGDWMKRYAFWTFVFGQIPLVIIVIRAFCIFPECRVRFGYMLDVGRMRELLSFASWCFLAILCNMLRAHGIMILFNKAFGPGVNAAYAIANQVDGKTNMLNESMKGAFAPAVQQAFGAGDFARMRRLSYGMCKFGLLSTLAFAIPLSLEIHAVLGLWLSRPPTFAAGLCLQIIIVHLLTTASQGFDTAVGATGRMAAYQSTVGFVSLLTLPVAALVAWMGGGVYGIGWTLVVMMAVYSVIRASVASRLTGMSALYWLRRILMPAFIATVASLALALPLRLTLCAGLLRMVTVGVVAEVVFLPLAWFLVLEREERTQVMDRVRKVWRGGR